MAPVRAKKVLSVYNDVKLNQLKNHILVDCIEFGGRK